MTDLINKYVTLDLDSLYHSPRTVLGKKEGRIYYDGRTSYDSKETYLTYDRFLIQHGTSSQCYSEQDFYDLIDDGTGLYLCCDGERVKVVQVHGDEVVLLNEEAETERGGRPHTFVLSREEFDIATNNKYKEELNDVD